MGDYEKRKGREDLQQTHLVLLRALRVLRGHFVLERDDMMPLLPVNRTNWKAVRSLGG